MKILVCEDDQAMMGIIDFTLKRSPELSVSKAIDGMEAMNKIKEESFDLILTDVHMPYHTGLEIVEFVRKSQKRNTPILVLSVEGYEDTVSKAFRMGADDYITKPFNPMELMMRIKKYLK